MPQISFEDLERVYKKWLNLDDDPDLLRILISVVIANRLEGAPVWAILIGPSGSGKSQMLIGFETCADILTVSDLTSASLASGYYINNVNDSLLFRANGKTVVIKDLSPLLKANKDERDRVFSYLRDAYDGRFERVTGKGTISWRGKIGILTATTPHLEKEREKETLLGERFINIRTRIVGSDDVIDMVLSGTTQKTSRDSELATATADYLDNFVTPGGPHSLPGETAKLLKGVSRALAKCRAGVDRDWYSKEIQFPAEVHELPTRLLSQFALLALAYKYTGADEPTVKKMVMRLLHDGIPYTRLRVLKAILLGKQTQADMAFAVGLSQQYINRVLEEMKLLRIIGFGKNWTITDPVVREAIKS